MAKELNLRKYQEDILARLELVSASTADSTTRLGIHVGGFNLLVNLSEISEVLPLQDLHEVPLTHSWFLGMSNVRGNLYGVTDLSQMLGQTAIVKTSNSRILLVNQEIVGQVGLLIDQLVGLRALDQFKIKKSKKIPSAFFRPFIYVDNEGAQWFELDCMVLIDSKEFMQPGLA